MFGWFNPKRRIVTLSFFSHLDKLSDSIIGEENPWADVDPLYHSDSDPLYLIQAGHFYLGHARLFDYIGGAESWAKSMKDATNIWSYWDMGRPLGPFAEDEQYKHANRGAKKVATITVDATNFRVAASKALEMLKQNQGFFK